MDKKYVAERITSYGLRKMYQISDEPGSGEE